MSKYKTTRIFALQTATHDYSFGPREKLTRFQKIVRAILIAPAIALFMMPSFKIGFQRQKEPNFAVPDRVVQGSVFTVPIDDSLLTIQVEGQSLPQIKASSPMLLAAARTTPTLELTLIYKGPEKKWSPRAMIPKLEHPTFEVFSKRIAVEPAPVVVEKSTDEKFKKPDATGLTRVDGVAQATCWSEPKTTLLPEKPTRNPRRLPIRYATLTAMAPGEVVKVDSAPSGKNITVYHGGGLYSRYFDLKETQVRKGDRITGGQGIAMMSVGTWRHPIKEKWDIHLGTTEINPASFLALSSQLCETK